MKITIQRIVRLILTVLLLWQVWLNSHWSVALSITLIMITLEGVSFALDKFLETNQNK